MPKEAIDMKKNILNTLILSTISLITFSSCDTSSPIGPGGEAEHTILIYLCGADLESSNSYGTDNLNEMLSVNIPSNVNVVVQTGGANKWFNSKLQSLLDNGNYVNRLEIRNKKINVKQSLGKVNMAASATFQSFLEWGLKNYPAKRTGVILWDHGDSMNGVCLDENYSTYSYDYLTNDEFMTAIENVYRKRNMTIGEDKFEWIGYDACLMGVLDLMTTNSKYFNYQVSSEETEPGPGWSYSGFLSYLAQNVKGDTESFLANICDTYKSKCDQLYIDEGYSASDNESTLSVVDLSKIDAVKDAFDLTFVNALKTKISSKSNFASFFKGVATKGKYGYDYDSRTYGDVFDIKHVTKKANTSYSISKTELDEAVEQAVIYKSNGTAHNDSCGIAITAPAYGWIMSSSYSLTSTELTNWRSWLTNMGTWY